MIVDVEIAAPFRKKPLDPGHFLDVLGYVRVYMNARIVAGEAAGTFELLGC